MLSPPRLPAVCCTDHITIRYCANGGPQTSHKRCQIARIYPGPIKTKHVTTLAVHFLMRKIPPPKSLPELLTASMTSHANPASDLFVGKSVCIWSVHYICLYVLVGPNSTPTSLYCCITANAACGGGNLLICKRVLLVCVWHGPNPHWALGSRWLSR